MENAIFVGGWIAAWWLLMTALRYLGTSWRTLQVLAVVWGLGGVALWFDFVR